MSAASKRTAELAARAAAVSANSTPAPAQPEPTEVRRSASTDVRESAPAEIRSQPPARQRSTSSPAAPATAPRTRPVRVTVELAPIEHRRLRRLCERYADEIGVPQVAGAEVFRVLLEMASEDEHLAAALGEALKRTGGSRRR